MLTSSGGTVVAAFYGAVDATLEEVAMRVQRVLMPDGSESWTVLDAGGYPVPAVEGFLAPIPAPSLDHTDG
ncbi:MAG TPA: hypothetical protein VII33_07090 [Nakamurella sp.]